MTLNPRQTLSLQHLLLSGRPLIVGTVHDSLGLAFVRKSLSSSGGGKTFSEKKLPLDLLEARLDSIPLRMLPDSWPLPVIVTARHPEEGGKKNLSEDRRVHLLREALPWASALDIELRSAKPMSPVIAEAHQHGRTLILSHHDFRSTPELKELKKLALRAADQGADLFKVATQLTDPSDLLRLIEFQMTDTKVPVVTMGMGAAGRFSRVVLSGFGAPLCYGWLGKPQIPGQWPALHLAELLAEVLPQ
jgi:3-dehydroquinate dehydratase-1